jgi:hypothetical protein
VNGSESPRLLEIIETNDTACWHSMVLSLSFLFGLRIFGGINIGRARRNIDGGNGKSFIEMYLLSGLEREEFKRLHLLGI